MLLCDVSEKGRGVRRRLMGVRRDRGRAADTGCLGVSPPAFHAAHPAGRASLYHAASQTSCSIKEKKVFSYLMYTSCQHAVYKSMAECAAAWHNTSALDSFSLSRASIVRGHHSQRNTCVGRQLSQAESAGGGVRGSLHVLLRAQCT